MLSDIDDPSTQLQKEMPVRAEWSFARWSVLICKLSIASRPKLY